MGYVFLALAFVFNAAANILIKIGSAQFAALRESGIVQAVAYNWALLAGLALFACNVVLYALALSRIPLSVGYPLMTAGGLAIITLVSVLYLRESITALQLCGLLLLAAGIVLVAYK